MCKYLYMPVWINNNQPWRCSQCINHSSISSQSPPSSNDGNPDISRAYEFKIGVVWAYVSGVLVLVSLVPLAGLKPILPASSCGEWMRVEKGRHRLDFGGLTCPLPWQGSYSYASLIQYRKQLHISGRFSGGRESYLWNGHWLGSFVPFIVPKIMVGQGNRMIEIVMIKDPDGVVDDFDMFSGNSGFWWTFTLFFAFCLVCCCFSNPPWSLEVNGGQYPYWSSALTPNTIRPDAGSWGSWGMVKDGFQPGRMLQDSPRFHQLILQQIQSTETVWCSVLWCKDTEVPKLRPMTFEGSKRVKPGGLVWKNASKTPKLPSSAWSKTILLVQGCFGASSHVKRGNLPSSCSKVKAHRCSDGKTCAEDLTQW